MFSKPSISVFLCQRLFQFKFFTFIALSQLTTMEFMGVAELQVGVAKLAVRAQISYRLDHNVISVIAC
jgi:hypothetical protein